MRVRFLYKPLLNVHRWPVIKNESMNSLRRGVYNKWHGLTFTRANVCRQEIMRFMLHVRRDATDISHTVDCELYKLRRRSIFRSLTHLTPTSRHSETSLFFYYESVEHIFQATANYFSEWTVFSKLNTWVFLHKLSSPFTMIQFSLSTVFLHALSSRAYFISNYRRRYLISTQIWRVPPTRV